MNTATSSDAAEGRELAMETLVSLCASRGFIFQSSEIYGGLVPFDTVFEFLKGRDKLKAPVYSLMQF